MPRRSSRRPRRNVSPERKGTYQLGIALSILGTVGVLVCFIGFAMAGQQSVSSMGSSGNPIGYWVGGVVCMVLIAVGRGICRVAARGVAGSGLVLDPERARDDLEPWARMGGGLVSDALDQAGVDVGRGATRDDAEPKAAADPAAKPQIMVRCRACGALNDEGAKFCDQCGAEL